MRALPGNFKKQLHAEVILVAGTVARYVGTETSRLGILGARVGQGGYNVNKCSSN